MKIGFIGLGKMGQQMVVRLLAGGHEVIVMDLSAASVALAVERGAIAAKTRADLLLQLGANPIIWVMIPASVIQTEIEALAVAVPEGAVIIDGGNSNFRATIKRGELVRQHGSRLVDVGTSGGVLGLEQGFSMMVGGDDVVISRLAPLFKSLAAHEGWAHFGPTGAGHYIKMIHNGIEYGLMEAYAEGYQLLKEGRDFPDLDLERVAAVWQHGSIIASQLNGITEEILRANPELEGIEGFVAATGEGSWTAETAAEQGIEMPALEAAINVRTASQQGATHFGTKLLAAMRSVFGGHAVNHHE